jgi:hypothetical protein
VSWLYPQYNWVYQPPFILLYHKGDIKMSFTERLNNFIDDAEANVLGYASNKEVYSQISNLAKKHDIDIVTCKTFNSDGCRFTRVYIEDDNGEFHDYEFCWG